MLDNKQSTFPNLLREYSSEFDTATAARKLILTKSQTGLGIHLVSGEQGLFVSSLIPGAPAHTSGEIRAGDKLLSVNGQDVSTATEREVEKLFTAKGENSVEIICQHKPEEFLQLQSRLVDDEDGDSLDRYLQGTEDESYIIKTDEKQTGEKGKKKPRAPKSSRSRDGGRSVVTSLSVRRGDSRGRRKSDAERYEELSAKWDQARHEVRQEDHETLQEKVTLQQELIRKQDAVAEQRRVHMAQLEAQKKDEIRNKKQAKEAELQQICKESLEEDKKAQRQERVKQLKLKRNEPLTSTPSPTHKSPTSPTTPRGRRSTSFRMTLPAMSATPDILDPEDELPEPEPAFVVPKGVPWHEQQLYNLYGKNADYFLHPKIEAKVQVKKANPKLRRQGGRAGAEVLWQTLRNDSNTRLMQEDASIPHHLKDAYGAFARQSLKKTNHPVRRMFCVDNDLPELTRIVDHSRVQQLHRMRHKRDLMYRSSVTNQDRTEVLKFNNPLPDFNERAESINQYLPSWQDDVSEESLPDYLRWLQQKGMLARENTIEEEGEGMMDELDDVKKPPQVTQSLDEDLMLILARRPPAQNKQKYVFLTEKDTRVKGEFSEKYKDEREYKDIPRPYNGSVPKSFSVMGGMISASPDKSSPSLRYSAPLPSRYEAIQRYTSGWEPLSMTALVEYKKQVSTAGEGEFSLGRTKMWSNIPVV